MQSVVDHSLRNFEAKFRYFAEHIDLMDSLFEATFSPLVSSNQSGRKESKFHRIIFFS
jgi:DNA topoisomerase-3